MHYILIRSTMKNGETAITRMLVQVDKTPPVIRLISPEAGGVYNEFIAYSASATDDVELVSLSYHLRVGDKAAYEIPGFLQGLYVEMTIPPFIRLITQSAGVANDLFNVPAAGGNTFMDFGFGLSFFDDNVKIQGQYGFMTQDLFEALGGPPARMNSKGEMEPTLRYGGQTLAFKLLANVYNLPFGMLIGPDFEWLFADFALGANFSIFDLGKEYNQSGKPTWLSALLLQVEFPKVTIPKREYFRTYSLFTEGQLWFVPTDTDQSGVVFPKIIMGVRAYIF